MKPAKTDQQHELARIRAAAEVLAGVTVGRQAHAKGIPRKALTSEAERIGWDEAAHDAGVALPNVTDAIRKDVREQMHERAHGAGVDSHGEVKP